MASKKLESEFQENKLSSFNLCSIRFGYRGIFSLMVLIFDFVAVVSYLVSLSLLLHFLPTCLNENWKRVKTSKCYNQLVLKLDIRGRVVRNYGKTVWIVGE